MGVLARFALVLVAVVAVAQLGLGIPIGDVLLAAARDAVLDPASEWLASLVEGAVDSANPLSLRP